MAVDNLIKSKDDFKSEAEELKVEIEDLRSRNESLD